MCPCVVGAVAALSGQEGSGGCGLAGVTLPGQEGNCARLKRDATINMLLGGGGHSVCHGGHCWAAARRKLRQQTKRCVVIPTEDDDGWDRLPLPVHLRHMG